MKPDDRSHPVLIVAPIGQDAAVMAELLDAEGISTCICDTLEECANRIDENAVALLLTQEGLESEGVALLMMKLKSQPSWSELPLIVLTGSGGGSRNPVHELAAAAVGTVTVLERPMHAATLLHAVEVAIRSRRRQYLVRDLLEGQQKSLTEIESTLERLRESEERYRKIAEHQKMLTAELSHRVKNTLASVQAIASQTRRFSREGEDFEAAFNGRIALLAQAHGLLTRTNWEGADMSDMVRTVLAPYPQISTGGVSLEGDSIILPPDRVLAMSMVLHELATNAAKYGSLSTPAGRVQIRWRRSNGEVRFLWREVAGPEVDPPQHRGFGTRLIERIASFELNGKSALLFAQDGVVCNMEFPLARS